MAKNLIFKPQLKYYITHFMYSYSRGPMNLGLFLGNKKPYQLIRVSCVKNNNLKFLNSFLYTENKCLCDRIYVDTPIQFLKVIMASYCEIDSLSCERDDEQMNIDENLSSVSKDRIVADLVDIDYTEAENETRSSELSEPSEVTDLTCSDERISPKSLLYQVTNFFQQNYPLIHKDLLHDGAICPSSFLTKLKESSEEQMKDSTQITIHEKDPLCVTATSSKMETPADEDVIDISVLYSDKFDQEFKKTETKNQGKKRKRKKKMDGKKEGKKYPTHFIALQIKDEEIHEKVKDLQSKLLESNIKYQKAVVSHEKLHMTLMVFHLTEENMDQAKLALNNAATEIINMFSQPLELTLQGLGHFNNKVLFAIGENQMLYKIAEIVEESMASYGIFTTDTRSTFKPHITIMKLSQDPKLYRQGIKKIDPVIWEDYKDTKFGSDCITSLQICSMTGGKGEDGYYQVCHVSSFVKDTV
ncbi:uncharacterized protein LOC126818616 isoform X3 [Patella vulgata]|uniref:uncharacterized protein LOC126818616 isoform X3 n=1 Tax=Patella vulgata TaxID=6465 RepID=UPI0021805008|nr:uncharacterized protein LOC126818616 isoform X3 [Patella vulgata]